MWQTLWLWLTLSILDWSDLGWFILEIRFFSIAGKCVQGVLLMLCGSLSLIFLRIFVVRIRLLWNCSVNCIEAGLSVRGESKRKRKKRWYGSHSFCAVTPLQILMNYGIIFVMFYYPTMFKQRFCIIMEPAQNRPRARSHTPVHGVGCGALAVLRRSYGVGRCLGGKVEHIA